MVTGIMNASDWTKGRSFLLALLAAAPPGAAEDLVVPKDHSSIQGAINAARSGDRVIIEAGEYAENFRLRSQIDVRGRETARVIVRPRNPAMPTASLSAVNGAVLGNITFAGGDIAVDLENAIGTTIASNVFDGVLGTALRSDVASSVEVSNNVFRASDVAIRRGSTLTRVTNNIFAGNRETFATASGGTPSVLNVSFNCFFRNGDTDSGLGTSFQVGDPVFVDQDRRDFHLQQGSACIDTGTGTDVIDSSTADAGAFGGGFADPNPFPAQPPDAVAGVSGTEIALSWKPNLSYLVSNSANPGGYRVHYSLNTAGPPFDGRDAAGGTQPSPIDVGSGTNFTLAMLTPIVSTPPQPQLLSAEPRDKSAVVTWSPVEGASAYRVLYGINASNEQQIDAGAVTTATVTGLANGTTYRFAVIARAQARYYLAVTVVDNTPSRHESAFSETTTVGLGPIVESSVSNELQVIPGPTIPVPDLPDEGCFIATAAYGTEWTAELAILRDFRDRYLLPNRLGRALAEKYYSLSPPLARYIDEHDSLKLPVRALLSFYVLGALLIMGSSPLKSIAIVVLAAALVTLKAGRFRERLRTGAAP